MRPWIRTTLFAVACAALATRFDAASAQRLAPEPTVAGAAIDGPYVFERDGRRDVLRLRRDASGAIVVERARAAGDSVVVEVDDAGPRRFEVPLRATHPRGDVDVPMPSKLLVASDFEGEFDAFVALMRANGVLDARMRWAFGKGHVMLVGDLVDRGRNVVPLLWLVYRLEAEARAAGGRLHYVLGNHEQKLLAGRTEDVHPKYIGTIRAAALTHAALWGNDSELGRWLRSKPVVLKVGRYLFMHGGVSPEVLRLEPTLAAIDAHAAAWFARPPEEVTDPQALAVLWDRTGVLWYRGLATSMEGMPKADAAHVDAVLSHFGVRHVVIGHTLARHVATDYDGRVIRVDVHHATGTVEGVLIDSSGMSRVDASGARHALGPVENLR